MRRGDHDQVQRMFRARIGAQAFTVVAIVAGGAYYGEDRKKRAELLKLEAQQRAEERHARWLHELEVRDAEERNLQDAMRKRRERVESRRAADRAATAAVKDETGRQGDAADAAAAAVVDGARAVARRARPAPVASGVDVHREREGVPRAAQGHAVVHPRHHEGARACVRASGRYPALREPCAAGGR